MTVLASASIFGVVLDALEDIEILSGSQKAPASVSRYDKARRRTAELPAIQLRRMSEDQSGSDDGSDGLDITVNGEICLYGLRDEQSSETYDEVIEADVGDLLKAFYSADWEAILGDAPILNVTWSPLQVQIEEEPEDGAVITFTVRYKSEAGHLQAVMQPWKQE